MPKGGGVVGWKGEGGFGTLSLPASPYSMPGMALPVSDGGRRGNYRKAV